MNRPKRISTYIFFLSISLLFSATAHAQREKTPILPDSTAWFQGVEVSAEMVGAAMKLLGDRGQYEAGVRINLKDRYFPVAEVGYGMCDHEEKTTSITYKTKAPYGRIGLDFNVMKNKHDAYRLYLGARYGFTSFKADYSSPPVIDAKWGGTTEWGETGMKCKYHWAEAVFGVQVKIWKFVHLGWSMRYKKRISYSEGEHSKAWYVPGFGKSGNSNIMGTFHLIFVI